MSVYETKDQREKRTVSGGSWNNDYWIYGGEEILKGSEEGKAIDQLWKDSKSELDRANEILELIAGLRRIASGEVDPAEVYDADALGRSDAPDVPTVKGALQYVVQESELLNEEFTYFNWGKFSGTPTGFIDVIDELEAKTKVEAEPHLQVFERINNPKISKGQAEALGAGESVEKVFPRPAPPKTPANPVQSIRGIDAQIAAKEKKAEQQAIRDIDVGAISQSLVGTGVADLVGADDSALVAQDDPIFGVSGLGQTPLDPADSETPADGVGGGGGGGGGGGLAGPSLAEQRAADRDEIYQLLTEQFGGASYFFRDHATNMLIGITGDGSIVSYNDPEAETQKGLMDYIVENGITSPARVKGLLQKTEWWQTTDKERRFFDVSWGEMSGPEQAEWLEPVTKALQDEAQYLGVELSDERAFELGQMLAMEGNGDDQEEIRKILFDEDVYTGVSAEISGFAGAQDAVQQLAYTYYTPIDDDSARDWAEKIYTGESTQEEYEQFLKSTAVSRFPTLDKVINQMGVTPQQYFAPYKQQIEQMLGRQVDLLDEFSDVIEYMPDTGGTTSRPMTLSEVRKFVRATPEWQQTDDAKDQARALAFSIGQSFGEVA